MKKLVIVGIVILLVCVGLSGCTSNPLDTDKNKLVGTWNTDIHQETGFTNYTYVYTFFSDGTLSYTISTIGGNSIPGSWEIKDDKLIINAISQSVNYYSFSNNDRTLTLTSVSGGASWNLYKQ